MKKNNKNYSEFAMSANWERNFPGAPEPNPASARDTEQSIASVREEQRKKFLVINHDP